MRRSFPFVLFTALASFGLAACGGGTGQLRMTAAESGRTAALVSSSDYSSILLELREIEGRLDAGDSDESGWRTLRSTPIEVDLIALEGGEVQELFDVEVPVGTITELRLILAEDVVGRAIPAAGGAEVPVRVPSGTSSGLKFKGSIEIVEDETAEATMAFDVAASLRDTTDGSLRVSPVIEIVEGAAVESR